jgi:hypothetical protein
MDTTSLSQYGGGGYYGGGGGGIEQDAYTSTLAPYAGQDWTVWAGGGGGGAGYPDNVKASSAPASVTLSWYSAVSSTTGVIVSSLSVPSFGSATATATVTLSTRVMPTGSVQFYVDDQPFGSPVPVAPVGSGPLPVIGTASAQLWGLSVGTHTVTATYEPSGNLMFTGSTSLIPRPLTVSQPPEGDFVLGKDPARSGLDLEVNGTNGGVDIWQQVGSGDSTQSNEVWSWEPDGSDGYGWLVNNQNGQCLEVNGTTGAVDTWPCVYGAPNELWRLVANMVSSASGQTKEGTALQVRSSG